MCMWREWWKVCLTVDIRIRTLCKYIFTSAERKFNTVFSSPNERYIFDQDLHWYKSVLRISNEEMQIRKSAIGVLHFWKRNCTWKITKSLSYWWQPSFFNYSIAPPCGEQCNYRPNMTWGHYDMCVHVIIYHKAVSSFLHLAGLHAWNRISIQLCRRYLSNKTFQTNFDMKQTQINNEFYHCAYV